MRGALDAVRAQGVPIERVVMVGGGARSRAVRALASGILGAEVEVPSPAEYVALGAAKQAAALNVADLGAGGQTHHCANRAGRDDV